MRCERIANWFPMVPERTKRAASWEVRVARWDSRALVVPSSQKTSSAKVLDCIAWSIERVGVVIVSPENC